MAKESTMLGHHIRCRLESDRLLHTSAAQRRNLVRAVHKTCRPFCLLAFGCGGTHFHQAAKENFQVAGELGRRVEISLQLRNDFGSPFLRVHRKAFEDQRHLFSAVLYDMRQRQHHELASDPYLEATSAPDLLGARVLGAYLIPRVREHVPELRRRHLLDLYEIDDLREAETFDNPAELLESVLAAFALENLQGHAKDVKAARQVLVEVAGKELTETELAILTSCSERTVRRLRKTEVPPQHERAVRRQLDLRRRIGASRSEVDLD